MFAHQRPAQLDQAGGRIFEARQHRRPLRPCKPDRVQIALHTLAELSSRG